MLQVEPAEFTLLGMNCERNHPTQALEEVELLYSKGSLFLLKNKKA
jgi:hypothetical protein